MRLKAPLTSPVPELDRQQQLREFVRSSLDALGAGSREILLVARAPESMVAKIVFGLSEVFANQGVSARILFAGGALVKTGEAWHLSFDPGFQHATRLLRDPRFLDGHEQLVIGTVAQWFGDSMRREPDKRDAFASYCPGGILAVGQSQATFERLWTLAEPIYVHSLETTPQEATSVETLDVHPDTPGSMDLPPLSTADGPPSQPIVRH